MINRDDPNAIELEYDYLPIVYYDGKHEYDKEIFWSYFVDKDEIIEILVDYVPDEVYWEDAEAYVKDHFDEMFETNKQVILDHFYDYAKEDAEEHYTEDSEDEYDAYWGMQVESLNKSKKKEIINQIKESIRDFFSDLDDEDYEDLVEDYLVVEIVPAFDNDMYKVEVRAELSYNTFIDLIDEKLNPIIKKYDNDAYFDMEDAGIANTFLSKESLK